MTQVWFVDFSDEAESGLAKLDREFQIRVIEKIDWLSKNFDQINPIALGNKWHSYFKLRVGNYRVIYKIDYLVRRIEVVIIEHRSKIYQIK